MSIRNVLVLICLNKGSLAVRLRIIVDRIFSWSTLRPNGLARMAQTRLAFDRELRTIGMDGTMDSAMLADPARDDLLILVDGRDREIGSATKMQTHVEGLFHRAFSVVLVRDGETGPELLLAKRSLLKYHSGGLWANSCCSHPRLGEDTIEAAYRRVREELGCEADDLRELTAFAYRAEFDNGLCEYEYDHVIVGRCASTPSPDPAEASEVRWTGFDDLARELTSDPRAFAAWAPMVFTLVMDALAS